MNKLAAALAVTFLVAGLVSGFALYRTAVNYDTATQALLVLGPDIVSVDEIRIPPIVDTSVEVSVYVRFRVTNPTATPIIVMSISFQLYNDDVGDPRPMVVKLDERYVYLGMASLPEPLRLEPDEVVFIEGTVVVGGTVGNINVLNTTDENGNYHPIITGRTLVELPNFGLKRSVRGIFYTSGPEGVPPYEG